MQAQVAFKIVAGGGHGLGFGGRAPYQGFDIDTRHGQREQPHRRQHRKAAAHVVGHDVGRIALAVGQLPHRPLARVGNGHDARARLLLAVFLFQMRPQQPERDGGLGRRARFGNDADAVILTVEIGQQLVHIVFAQLMAGIEDFGAAGHRERQGRLQGLDDGLGPQIRAADADAYEGLRLGAQFGRPLPHGLQFRRRGLHRRVEPAQEVVARPLAALQRMPGLAQFIGQLLVVGRGRALHDLLHGLSRLQRIRKIQCECFCFHSLLIL